MLDLQPSSTLVQARKRLDGESWIKIESDWEHFERDKFYFRIAVTIDESSRFVPSATSWYVLATNSYPFGKLELLPAKEGGLAFTFPHQRLNVDLKAKVPWLDGNPCLSEWNSPVKEAIDEFDLGIDRLAYLVYRLAQWLRLAATNRLVKPGDFFELPDFTPSVGETMAYFEDESSFSFWEDLHISESVGICEMTHIGSSSVIRRFKSSAGKPLRNVDRKEVEHPLLVDDKGSPRLSKSIAPTKSELLQPTSLRPFAHIVAPPNQGEEAAWVLLPDVPSMEPWHPPQNWLELRQIMNQMDEDYWAEFHALLRSAPRVRKAVIGMPIPKRIGDQACQIHWQGLMVPRRVTNGEVRYVRPTKRNLFKGDLEGPLGQKSKITWLASQNWSSSQMSRRLNECQASVVENILVIGCGAFGTILSDLLVRGGTKNLWLCDPDFVVGGNLVRGTFQIRDVGKSKVSVLADRLSAISPHVKPKVIQGTLAKALPSLPLEQFDYIFDCSAENVVLVEIERAGFKPDAKLISLSSSWKASRLLAIHSKIADFNASEARTRLRIMHGDLPENFEIRSEGTGCFHPAFPADPHRIALSVAVALERLQSWAESDSLSSEYFNLETNTWNG